MNPDGTPYPLNPIEAEGEERRRGGRPAGGDGHLAELRHLDDYVIADGDPDIRGRPGRPDRRQR